MSRYHNDQPIKGGSTDPDLLNRSEFASHLADILILDSEDDCLTVSLEGEWGYGKTSVINLIKDSLNNGEVNPIIIEYNPWLAGSPESLIQDFLLQLSSKLNIKDASAVSLKAAEELIAYSGLFGVAKLVPGAEPWASIVEKVFSRFGSTTKKISKLKELDVLGKKKKVVKAIECIKSPIVVVIDDIDRLTPSEAFQILRLVKAVADFPGTSFLLAFDSIYLASVLGNNNIVNASEYLDKVIQLRVSLPVISERSINDLAQIEFKNLGDGVIIDRFEGDQERLSWIYQRYFKNLIKNPRELKRFFNHLRFVIEQIDGQVCFTDLFCLSLIAIKANPIYEHIKSTPQAYIGRGISKNDLMIDKTKDVIKSFEAVREMLLDAFEAGERKLLSGLIGDVFPLLDTDGYAIYSASDKDAAGRVSAPQRLHVALQFSTPIGYLSDQNILDFIAGNVDRKEFVESVIKDEAVERFFEMMINYSNKCNSECYEVLCSIFDVFLESEIPRQSLERNVDFLSSDPLQHLNWLTSKVITECDHKHDLIMKLISRKENAPFSANIIYKARHLINEPNHNDALWITSEQLAELEGIYIKVALSVLSARMFFENHLESQIYYELKRVAKEEASKFIVESLEKVEGVIRVAEIIGYTGSDSVNGPYVVIDDELVAGIVDLDILKLKSKLIKLDAQTVRVQAVLKSIIDGKKYYLRDGKQRDDW